MLIDSSKYCKRIESSYIIYIWMIKNYYKIVSRKSIYKFGQIYHDSTSTAVNTLVMSYTHATHWAIYKRQQLLNMIHEINQSI